MSDSRPAPAAARTTLPWLLVLGAAAAAAALALSLAWVWPLATWAAPLAAALSVGVVLFLRPLPAAADAGPVPRTAASDASLRDAHTGMFHRAAFLALAERDWARAARYGGAVALMVVEVDRLRSMTDRSGPAVADALLGGLGRQVLASLRGADLLARFDDAQLAVFLPHADTTGALDVADRIREGVEHLQLNGMADGSRFTASIGVVVLRPLHQPLSALVSEAQLALNSARLAGGNCVRMAPQDAFVLPHSDTSLDNTTRPARGSSET